MGSGLFARLTAPTVETKRTRPGGFFDPLVCAILQSPFQWLLSRQLMLVTIKGRRTDNVYTIPVEYRELDALVLVMVPGAQKRTWWRNFTDPTYAQVTIRGWRTAAKGFAPEPDSPEFAQAAEQMLKLAPFFGQRFGIRYDKNEGLRHDQLAQLATTSRVVIFDRNPPLSESSSLATVALQRDPVPQPVSTDDRITRLVDPVIADLSHGERPAALALVQRLSAEMCRVWAKQASDPTERQALEECAVAEDDIASRVEASVAGALSIQERVARTHPQLVSEYFDLFKDLTSANCFALQAQAQHETADTWQSLAGSNPADVRGVLLECSDLQKRSATALEALAADARAE